MILPPNCVSAWLIKGCVCGEINTALTVHGVMMESRTMAYLTTVRNIWVSKDKAANNDPVLRLTHNNCILLPLRRKQRAIWTIWRVYETNRWHMSFIPACQHIDFESNGSLKQTKLILIVWTFVWLWCSNQQRCINVILNIHFSITISKKRVWCLIWQNVEKLNTLHHKVCLIEIK